MARPTVFISATFDDLRAYRAAARDAALRAGFFPALMEAWTAEAREPLAVCLRRVDEAELLIAVVAQRYGWTPPDQPAGAVRKSITWLECERAVARGKDVLAFVLDDTHPWPAEWREDYRLVESNRHGELTPARVAEIQQDMAALTAFKHWLGTGRTLAKFTTPDDLAVKLESALHQWAAAQQDGQQANAGDGPLIDRPDDYLRGVYERTGTIEIRGLQVGSGRANRFPIDELYIPLTSLEVRRTKGEGRKGIDELAVEGGRVELDHALRNRRLAIIGDPGAGKSTFLRRIAFLLARSRLGLDPPGAPVPLGLDDRPFPLLLTIAGLAEHIRNAAGRDGAPTRAEAPGWLAHYLAACCREEGRTLGEPFLRRQLEEGRAILLIDGLDEAATDQDRARLARLVEAAADSYRGCRIVLTSRPAAYRRGVELPGFAEVRIEPLEDAAIDGFLRRWCTALFPDSPAQAAAHGGQLLDALRSRPEIRRLARNPVMLTALAVVHWHEKRLPEQRADLYESILGWLAAARETRPDRPKPDRCIALLQTLALALQEHPDGRQVQVPRHWAARHIAGGFRDLPEAERVEGARQFLLQEELDSGIVVGRGDDVRFWHLTFQEYLAARALAARPGDVRDEPLFREEKLYAPEWRETVLLLAGVLYHQGIDRVDAMVAAVLDTLPARSTCSARVSDPADGTDRRSPGSAARGDLRSADSGSVGRPATAPEPPLDQQARAVGLLGAAVADLAPVNYQPRDPRYRQTLDAVMAIFRPDSSVPITEAIAAAEALGRAGDPRLAKRQRVHNWVTIPAGEFWMGAQKKNQKQPNYDPDAFGDEAPVHRVRLGAYRMGRYPVTVLEYGEFVDNDGYADEPCWAEGGFGKFKAPEGWEEQKQHPNWPVVGVSWYEAQAYCRWAGVRLPTEAEWERAARGDKQDGRPYPWGKTAPDATRMNYATGKYEDWQNWKPNVDHPTPVGIYPRGASPEGLLDMAGNVWEWCADWSASYEAGEADNPTGPSNGSRRVVRGGSWPNHAPACRVAYRSGSDPTSRSDLLGFRVCGGVGGQD